jgi:tetratricopeptide (TPR) repeat protein
VVIALLAGAWLLLGIRAIELESERPLGSKPAEVRSALNSLRSARFLSVDKEPLLNEGLLLFAVGRHDEALAVGKRVVSDEPDNLDAWLALYYMYWTSRAPKRADGVAQKVRTLNPLAGDRLKDMRLR